MFEELGNWVGVKDGDPLALALYHRHYSYRPYKDGRKPKLFCGPGEKSVLVTRDYSALFVWKKFKSLDNQAGINCSIFRNESPVLSSLLILEAEQLAWNRWPGQRLYTYVDGRKTTKRRGKAAPPGMCFIHAGWQECGITKAKGLIILEKLAS
jgi:hypothetical protein